MFSIAISQELKEYCGELITNHNFGNRGFADGNREEQYTGLIGQSMICRLLGSPLPTGEGGFDEGVDIEINGLRVDVKTMGRTTPVREYYVNNFIALQKIIRRMCTYFAALTNPHQNSRFVDGSQKTITRSCRVLQKRNEAVPVRQNLVQDQSRFV